jgi:predicted transcriptional regulator
MFSRGSEGLWDEKRAFRTLEAAGSRFYVVACRRGWESVMADSKVHVGDTVEDMGRRFIDAWHRAERGERMSERHLSFDGFETLARVPTPERMELLRHLHHSRAAGTL